MSKLTNNKKKLLKVGLWALLFVMMLYVLAVLINVRQHIVFEKCKIAGHEIMSGDPEICITRWEQHYTDVTNIWDPRKGGI